MKMSDLVKKLNSSEKIIKKLDQCVIDKISAGEIIHRPLNVVKELLENSLDAGATSITITLKRGGLEQITLHDNGCGIDKEYLEILCKRFTTSKLSTIDDFKSLNTFGFRGEALCSISMVSKLTVITKTSKSICGYKAKFIDGKVQEDSITKVAANNGSIFVIDNLFYNMPSRRSALSSESQEFQLVHELVSKYAIIFSGKCGFILKRDGQSLHSVHTNQRDDFSTNIDNINAQQKISCNLMPINLKDEQLKYKIQGYFSNNDLNLKKMSFILSINSRLVECSALKNSMKKLYKDFLMKNYHPFILLMIDIDPENIDVNIHPTKNEVCFLHEDAIISKVNQTIQDRLSNNEQAELSSSFRSQSSLEQLNFSTKKFTPSNSPNFCPSSSSKVSNQSSFFVFNHNLMQTNEKEKKGSKKLENEKIKSIKVPSSSSSLPSSQKPSKFIRIDSTVQRIDQFINRFNASDLGRKRQRRSLNITTVQELIHELSSNNDQNDLKLISDSTYVGCVDKNYILIQNQLNLFLVNTTLFNQDLFYQIYLSGIGNFDYIRFDQPLSLEKLLSVYFEANIESSPTKNDRKNKIEKMISSLWTKDKNIMMDDYFSIQLNIKDGTLVAIPELIEGHAPQLWRLPELVYQLINEVDWADEKECFRTVGQVLTRFYSHPPDEEEKTKDQQSDWAVLMCRKIFPLYKTFLFPSRETMNGSVHLITDVTTLYKVFERC